MDKIYDKPTATHIVFYSQEKITEEIPLPGIQVFANGGDLDIGASNGSGDYSGDGSLED